MQEQRATIGSLPETFGFIGGNDFSTTDDMNTPCEPFDLNDFLIPDDADSPYFKVDMRRYFSTSDGVGIACENASDSDLRTKRSLDFTSPSSSVHACVNQSDLNGTEREHQGMPCLEQGLHERRVSNGKAPILNNLDVNASNTENTFEQFVPNNSGPNNLQNSYPNNVFDNERLAGCNGLALGIRVYNDQRTHGFVSGQLPPCNNSIFLHGASMGENVAMDGGSTSNERRLPFKRKHVVLCHSYDVARSIYFEQGESSSIQLFPSSANMFNRPNVIRSSDSFNDDTPTEALNPAYGSGMNLTGTQCHTSLGLYGNAESAHRNVRMRRTPASQHGASVSNLQPANNSSVLHGIWHHPLPLPTPPYQTGSPMVGTSSQVQSHAAVISGIPWSARPFSLNAGHASASTSHMSLGEEVIAPREEANGSNITRNSFSQPLLSAPRIGMRLAQDPVNWSLSSGNVNVQGGAASSQGASTSVVPPASANLLPHQSNSSQYQLNLELVRQSLGSAGPETVNLGNGIQSQHGNHLLPAIPPVPSRGARVRGSVPPPRFSARPEQRMAAIRERRSRVMSEIRNALTALHSGEDITWEELILEQAFLRAADLHDRHRDMRLDIDNMSYEELLALEERIGYVSTGLSEETILKCLKLWNYLPSLEQASSEVEPCCICQEDYIEGVEMGTLNCGHDFHNECIKQWLKEKNSCPVCKAAALAT